MKASFHSGTTLSPEFAAPFPNSPSPDPTTSETIITGYDYAQVIEKKPLEKLILDGIEDQKAAIDFVLTMRIKSLVVRHTLQPDYYANDDELAELTLAELASHELYSELIRQREAYSSSAHEVIYETIPRAEAFKGDKRRWNDYNYKDLDGLRARAEAAHYMVHLIDASTQPVETETGEVVSPITFLSDKYLQKAHPLALEEIDAAYRIRIAKSQKELEEAQQKHDAATEEIANLRAAARDREHVIAIQRTAIDDLQAALTERANRTDTLVNPFQPEYA